MEKYNEEIKKPGGMLRLYIQFYVLKLREYILRPLSNIPRPDFNKAYDHTML
jgi:hypothetical protein